MWKNIVGIVAGVFLFPALSFAAEMNLKWVDNSNNESGFKIERSVTGNTADFTVVHTTAANIVAFVDTNLAEGVTYYYRVCAFNPAGNSTYTNIASAKTTFSIPNAPTGLTVTP